MRRPPQCRRRNEHAHADGLPDAADWPGGKPWTDACGDDEKNAVRDEARGAADKVLEALSSAIDETHDWDKAVDLTRRLMFIERFLEQNAD